MTDPTTRELNIIINSLKEHVSEQVGDVGQKIDGLTTQVKITNGDVKGLKMWRSFVTGGMSVITAIVIPLLIYIWYQQITLTQSVADAVSEALAEQVMVVGVGEAE